MERVTHVLAVDGGGSKTAAALLTLDGAEVARCRAGPANLYREPVAGLVEIERAWRILCELADISPTVAAPRTVVSAGLAGASGATQRQAFAAAFAAFAGRRLSSDGYVAYLGVFGTAPGAMVSIGTGVVAFRCIRGGRPEVRAGWGFPAADRGSGAWLGLRLVGEYLDHLDAASPWPDSGLWAAVAEAIGRDREDILGWLRQARAAEFATLAPAVVAAAHAGDPLGTELLAEGATHIARLARAVVAETGGSLCLAGGLAETYRPLVGELFADLLVPPERKPDPLRGAWLVATGAAEAEYGDVA